MLRCAIRIRAENADEKTFVPALFPPLPEVQEDDPCNWLAEDDPVSSIVSFTHVHGVYDARNILRFIHVSCKTVIDVSLKANNTYHFRMDKYVVFSQVSVRLLSLVSIF